MIIADENLEKHWIDLFRSNNYSVLSIAESHAQTTDEEVAKIARGTNGILITEDKDFGEFIFAHGIPKLTIIFLRYDQPLYTQIEAAVLETVAKYHTEEKSYFITITKTKIRVRSI